MILKFCHLDIGSAPEGFHVGRILEGQFEYPSLNGWMTPLEAKMICEEDLQILLLLIICKV